MNRRQFMKVGIGTCAACTFSTSSIAEESDDPKTHSPQPGDVLVTDSEEQAEIRVSDLKLGQPMVLSYPKDPLSGVVRDGTRFNKIMLIRLDEKKMNNKTRKLSVDGIVAFSGICTHEGCDVNSWLSDKEQFFCFCHYSRFNPYKSGKVANGPAKRRLPMLPIRIEQDLILVDGSFTRRVGKKKST